MQNNTNSNTLLEDDGLSANGQDESIPTTPITPITPSINSKSAPLVLKEMADLKEALNASNAIRKQQQQEITWLQTELQSTRDRIASDNAMILDLYKQVCLGGKFKYSNIQFNLTDRGIEESANKG